MELKESKIGSVKTLLSLVTELSDDDHVIFFRGHADKNYSITPSIYRKRQWYSNEQRIVREIIMRCPSEFSNMQSSFERLVKMQHYDLPTRLLDLTENPLVALYFACVGENEEDSDGEFMLFKVPKQAIKYYDSDTVSILSNISWSNYDFEITDRFRNNSKSFHSKDNHHALKLMHDIKQEKPHFLERIEPKDIESVICVKPKMDNPRVIRQDGAFLLFGINGNKSQPAEIPGKWLYRPDSKRYIIKAADKLTILKQLAGVGISKAKLFPEVDMVAQFIKNDYELKSEDFSSSIKKYSPPKIDVHWP